MRLARSVLFLNVKWEGALGMSLLSTSHLGSLWGSHQIQEGDYTQDNLKTPRKFLHLWRGYLLFSDLSGVYYKLMPSRQWYFMQKINVSLRS